MTKVTFKEVAALAGVSTQTVSRVTNNVSNVTEATRKRVQAAIDQLGYVPSKSAQLLGRHHSKMIGLITLDLTFLGAAMVAAAVRRSAQQAGYSLALSIIDAMGFSAIKKAVQELRAQQVDALIINLPLTQQHAQWLVEAYPNLPFVFGDTLPAQGLVTVMSNHIAGATATIEHLLQQQRRQFFLLNGDRQSPAAQLRREGWLMALNQHGLSPAYEACGHWSATQAYRCVTEAIKHNQTFDAIVCANDQMALGVLKALHDCNRTIKTQIAVTGFDDTPDSVHYQPSLTTVQQRFDRIGNEMVRACLSGIDGQAAVLPVTVEVALVVRGSG